MTNEPKRFFNEDEVSAILKTAVDMDSKGGGATSFGLSLEELQQIAAESGIDPRNVAAAISQLDHQDEKQEKTFWGGPTSWTQDRVVEGGVDEEQWENMVAVIRKAYGDTGEVQMRGHTKEWIHSGKSNVQAHVAATTRDGRTRISAAWHEPTIAALYVPFFITSIILIPIFFDALDWFTPTGVAAYLAAVAILFSLGRFTVSGLASKREQKLNNLVTDLEQLVESDGGSVINQESTTQTQSGSAGETINTDELDATENESTQSQPRRIRS